MKRFARLFALDASFLTLETETAPFVVGARLVFEPGSLRKADGDLDTVSLIRFVAATIGQLRRYRQRLARVPLFGNPVWVDDADFDLARHLYFTRLDPPGSDRQLDELVGDILSRDLDMTHPPWEFHVIDRLERGRFAILAKVHHCMVDGIAGVRLLESLLHESPRSSSPEPGAWFHRPPPPRLALLAAEVLHRVRGLGKLARSVKGSVARTGARRKRPSLRDASRLLRQGLTPAARVGVNPRRIDRGRRFGGFEVPLDEISQIKDHVGVTLNDVVLAVVAGGFRRFLARRGVDLSAVRKFRAMVPVNLRRDDDRGIYGSHVGVLLVPLPIDARDPLERCRRVGEFTRDRKEDSHDVASGELMMRLADVTSPALLGAALAVVLAVRAFNVVVTNIPGPRASLYLLDARLESFYPIVNIWHGQAVGLALMSYSDRLFWGVHAARKAFAGAEELVDDLRAALDELVAEVQLHQAQEPARRAGP